MANSKPGKPGRRADPELDAINVILNALDGLDGESIQRVLDYVTGRLSLGRSATVSTSATPGVGHIALSGTTPPGRQ